jgi:hypothetical protein
MALIDLAAAQNAQVSGRKIQKVVVGVRRETGGE